MAGPLDERVLHRIVAETRGNPLALLELPRGRTPEELAGGFGLLDHPGPLRSCRRELPTAIVDSSGRIAAAAPDRRGGAGPRPARDLGRGRAAGNRRRRRRAGGGGWVRRVSRTGAVLPSTCPIRGLPRRLARRTPSRPPRAWPMSPIPTATPIAEPGTARSRLRGSTRTLRPSSIARPAGPRARGGLAAAAAFQTMAAELTPDAARRGERALAAAQAKHQRGCLRGRATRAEQWPTTAPPDELQRARVPTAPRADSGRLRPRPRSAGPPARGREAP